VLLEVDAGTGFGTTSGLMVPKSSGFEVSKVDEVLRFEPSEAFSSDQQKEQAQMSRCVVQRDNVKSLYKPNK
jgi:hypothetical protein